MLLPKSVRKSGILFAGLLAGAFLAGCAQEPQTEASGVWRKSSTTEYFGQKRYGKASPRVVNNGRRVPKGGGRAIIGKPYKVAGKRYYPRQYKAGFTQTGRASWYGDAFHGRKTANGEIYDMSSISAAHPTMPLPSYARVTNQKNGRSIIVRVNDRGPFHGGRVMDLSKRVADLLDFRRLGTANVKVEYLQPASTAGSDDHKLFASLRTDGSPAQLDGGYTPGRTVIAGLSGRARRNPVVQSAQPVQQPQAVISTSTGRPQTTQVSQISRTATPVQASANGLDEGLRPEQSRAPQSIPVPASRPFDLATIPGASTPIAAYSSAGSSLPAVGLRRVSFFAPYRTSTPLASRLRKRGPFDGVDLTRLRPLNRQN